jgi:hypothetical protein
MHSQSNSDFRFRFPIMYILVNTIVQYKKNNALFWEKKMSLNYCQNLVKTQNSDRLEVIRHDCYC